MGSGKNLKFFYSQCMSMQFGKLISCICLFAALCILVQPVAAATQPDEATTKYNLAEIKLSQGEFEQAIHYFDQALAANTSMMEKAGTIVYVYSDKAGALIQLERYDEVISTADKGLAIDNTYPVLWNNKGYALYKLGRLQDAVNAFDKAILKAMSIKESLNKTAGETDSLVDSLPRYLTNKGDALYDLGRYQDAIAAYTKALVEDPTFTRATDGLARAQQKSSATTPVMIVAVIALIVVGCGVAYYVLKKKPSGSSAAEKEGKKTGKKK
jgi:tetratricopeptide (TPR) repeat protein